MNTRNSCIVMKCDIYCNTLHQNNQDGSVGKQSNLVNFVIFSVLPSEVPIVREQYVTSQLIGALSTKGVQPAPVISDYAHT